MFTLQYEHPAKWTDLVDDYGRKIKFVSFDHALFIARELSTCDHLPSITHNKFTWRILNDTGNIVHAM